jgi:hypothetical protein
MENRSNLFKVSALTAAMFGVVAMPVQASTESAAGDQYVEAINEFMADSALNGTFIVDTRARTRTSGKPGGKDGDTWSRLNYSSYNAILDFTSGYHDGWLGADIGGYYSGDLYNDSRENPNGNGEYLCNEISTCNNLDWGSGEGEQLKLYKAALKFKAGENFDARFGMIQANGNGTIGNVWSFVPGTYRGAELNANFGKVKATYFIADQFTAPWLLSEDDYAPALWADTSWGITHSLGLQVDATKDLFLQFGVGQTTDVSYANVDWANNVVSSKREEVDTTGYKVYARYNINDTMTIAYDFYGVDDDDQYDGLGYTTGLSFNANFGKVSWMSDVNYASSDNDADVNPRMIYTYGMTNGNYSLWWDALSDWNKSGQLSWYNRVAYNQGNGWNYYLGLGYGTGGKSAAEGATGDWDYESEYAFNATVAYSLQTGALKGSTVRLHGTVLERDEYAGAASADETDLRLQVIIPYSFN